jgi:single-strand DNA-binding protein
MSQTTNKVILIGNLGANPEIRQMQSGNFVATFSIATHESYKDNEGVKEITDWHNIKVFNPGIIQIVKKYLQKGSKVYIEGALKTTKYKDQQGNDRYSTFVKVSHRLLMLDSKKAKRRGLLECLGIWVL